MPNTTKRTIAALNDLIAVCRDGHDGYQAAAHGVGSMDLKRLFGKFALQRKGFEEELATEVERLGGTPSERGTIGGAIHRGWIELTAKMAEPLSCDVLKECDRGETASVEEYTRVLDKPLPPEAHKLVERQLASIAEARDRIRDLEIE